MIPPTASPPPACPDCGHAVAGSIDGRGWCIWCARECFIQHRRPSPGIATTKTATGGLASIVGKWPGDETDEQITAILEELS